MSGPTLEDRVARLEAWARSFGGGRAASPSAPKPATPATGNAASDKELDGKFGDPKIKKDPSRWEGASYVGRRYSQTEPAYLDSLAGYLDWRANKNQEEGDPARAKFIAFDRRDARLARGWAARLRARGTSPQAATPKAQPAETNFGSEDDIPF
jgi:hypothetical protein